MPSVQTLFAETDISSPLETHWRKTRDTCTKRENRAVIVGLAVGKALGVVAIYQGLQTGNHREVAIGTIVEAVMSPLLVGPLLWVQHKVTDKLHAAAKKIPLPATLKRSLSEALTANDGNKPLTLVLSSTALDGPRPTSLAQAPTNAQNFTSIDPVVMAVRPTLPPATENGRHLPPMRAP